MEILYHLSQFLFIKNEAKLFIKNGCMLWTVSMFRNNNVKLPANIACNFQIT